MAASPTPEHPTPFGQTWADVLYEWRIASTPRARLLAGSASLAALIRLAMSSVSLFHPCTP
jgi:hypothetical protein